MSRLDTASRAPHVDDHDEVGLPGVIHKANGHFGVERVKVFVCAVLRAAGDPEVDDRLKAVEDTAEALTAGKKDVTGWPKLVERLGVVARRW